MTNDFAVVDQQQTRKSPMWPAVGAIGGGVAGYVIGNRRGNAKTHEDLVKEAKDITDFSTKPEGEKELWETLNTKLKEQTRLEDELKKASEAKLPENTDVAKRLAEVEKEVEAKIKELQALENRKVGVTGVSGRFNPHDLPKFEQIPLKDLPETYVEDITQKTWLGDKIIHSQGEEIVIGEQRNYFDTLKSDVTNKYDEVMRKLKSSTFDEITGEGSFAKQEKNIATLETAVKDIVTDLNGKNETEIAKYFANTSYNDMGEEIISKAREKAQEIVNNSDMKKEISELSIEDVRSIGEIFDKRPTANYGETVKTVTFDVVDETTGRTHKKTEYIKYNNQRYAELKLQRNQELIEKRKSMVDEITSLLEDAYNRKIELNNFASKYEQRVTLAKAKETGLYDESSRIFNFNEIITKGNAKDAFDADIEAIERVLTKGTINPSEVTVIEGYVKKSGDKLTRSEIETALKYAKARKEVLGEFLDAKGEIEKLYNNSIRSTEFVTKYDSLIEKVFQNEQEYAKSLDKFKKAYPTLCEDAVVTSGTAKTIGREDLPQFLKDKLKKVSDEYAEAAKKDGKVDEEAKKKAEEALEKGKKDVEEAVNKLKEKLGKGGTKGKIIGAILGVAAGAGLLWLIAPKKSKEA